MEFNYDGYDPDHEQRERKRARDLRHSQWWKRKCSRGQCHWCGQAVAAKALTMDHVVPIARGGASTKGNVVPSCKTCNTKKRQLLPMEWDEYLSDRRQETDDPH